MARLSPALLVALVATTAGALTATRRQMGVGIASTVATAFAAPALAADDEVLVTGVASLAEGAAPRRA